jgi:putative redox protein
MADVKLNWEGGLKFTALGSSPLPVPIDGDREEGASPMEMILEALGGCTSIDVVMILNKMRQPLDRFEVSISGARRETDPRAYTSIEVVFKLWGEGLELEKVNRAVELSFEKYCSVYHSLNKEIEVTKKIQLNPQV